MIVDYSVGHENLFVQHEKNSHVVFSLCCRDLFLCVAVEHVYEGTLHEERLSDRETSTCERGEQFFNCD